MSKTVYLQYTIHLTDADQVHELQTTAHEGGAVGAVIMAPTVAATTYGAPILENGAPFKAPCITSAYFTAHDNNYPRDERTFERCEGGWFGVCFLFGTRTNYYWRGTFALAPVIDPVLSPMPNENKVAMAQRRWIDGAELPAFSGAAPGEDGTQAGSLVSRGASRHLGGYGYLFDSLIGDIRTHKPIDSGGAATKEQWERFYVRFHRFDPVMQRFWLATDSGANTLGMELCIQSNGQIVVSTYIAGPARRIITTVSPALAVHVWYRIDLLYRFGPSSGTPDVINTFRLFINGLLATEVGPLDSATGGIGANANIEHSVLGLNDPVVGSTTLCFDADDWIGSAWPLIGSEIQTGTTTSGSPIVTGLTSTTTIQVGAGVTGTGIPASTRILTIDSATQVTLDHNATATGSTALTFGHSNNYPGLDWNNGSKVVWLSADVDDVIVKTGTLTSGSAVVPDLSATAGIRPGKTVTGTGIPGGATVATVDSAVQITLSANATASGPAELTIKQASGFASDHDAVNWAGNWRIARQRPIVASGTNLTIGAAAGRLALVLDAGRQIDADLNALGIACLMVGAYGVKVGGTTVQFGYKLPGGAETLVAVTPTTNVQGGWIRAYYRPTPITDPVHPLGGLEVKLDKPTGMTSLNLAAVQAVAEVIGVFGTEDIMPFAGQPATATIQPITGQHNAPYPRSPWARTGTPPVSPVLIKGGTYVGTGTFIDVTFRSPVHFLWIRPATSASGDGAWWLATGVGPHRGLIRQWQPEGPVEVLTDPTFVGGAVEDAQETQVCVRIVGNRAESNQTGITYQYIAIGDPGMRFMECGVFRNHVGPGQLITPLQNPAFTPEALFLQLESLTDNTNGVGYYKGLGHAATNVNRLVGAEIASWLSMSVGTLKSESGFGNAAYNSIAFLAWRRDDKSDAAAADKARVLQLTSYIGDGSASRTISLAPITGRRPFFAIVVPHNAASVQRDPSHTGTNSTTLPGTANTTTGITAGGTDSMSVGSDLNANGIVYDVFVIPGSVEACNNGWSCNGEFNPVPPIPPPEPAPWIEPPEPTPQPVPTPGPPPTDGGGSDFGADCIVPSSKVINQALSRIGVSKRVGDVTIIRTGTLGLAGAITGLSTTADLAIGLSVSGGSLATGTVIASIDSATQVTVSPVPTAGSSVSLTFTGSAGIATERTPDADTARLHYADVVTAVLRDFPWPFATKYATLVVVAGPAPPANADWLYSYRRPADAVFERRIVVARSGAVDPTPPPFALSSDGAGGLLFTNQAAAVLEYTYRPGCSANLGDPLFREALTWKLAAAMGPALSRMTTIIEHCETQYLQALAKATLILRPGNPGAVPAAPTIDTAAASQTANVAVANRALLRIGARTVANLASDQGREATAVRVVFEDELRATLRDFPWPFASKYATLAVVSGPAPPANSDWLYAYRQPADCVFERRLVATRGTAVDPPAIPFQLSADATGGLILTNQASAVIEYTARLDGAVALADSLFKDALSWRLVAALAPSLAAVDPTQPEQQGRGPDDPAKPHEHPTNAAQRHLTTAAYAMQMYGALLAQAERVLRPGKPGTVPAAPTIDTAAAAKTANTNVVNRALVRIGAQTIVELTTDQSREATAARLVFEDELQSTLRDFPWGFATVYATPTLVAGTASVGVNGDWQYSYRLPTDAVFVRRAVTSFKRGYDPNPPPYHVGRDATGSLLFTNQTPAVIEYTARLDGTVLKADAEFRDAFAWRLAASLAPSLAQIDPARPEQLGRGPDVTPKDPARITQQSRLRTAQWAWQMYGVALSMAKVDDANEQQGNRPDPDADWITGRG